MPRMTSNHASDFPKRPLPGTYACVRQALLVKRFLLFCSGGQCAQLAGEGRRATHVCATFSVTPRPSVASQVFSGCQYW